MPPKKTHMHDTILFIGGDIHLLKSCTRHLADEFTVHRATAGEEGLRLLREQGPFAAVVSDLHLPDLNGLEVLRQVRQITPETVRILLTDQADQHIAINAANTGKIFRFLSKPCAPQSLTFILRESVRQYQLAVAERELLELTLVGVVGVLSQILSLVNPVAQGKANRLKQYCRHIAREVDYPKVWLVEMAAMLSQLGCLTIPPEILIKQGQGMRLKPEESAMLQEHPEIAVKLLMQIPRFEDVVEIIALQNKTILDIPSFADPQRNERVRQGGLILHTALALDTLLMPGQPPEEVLDVLSLDPSIAPELVEACRSYDFGLQNMVRLQLSCAELNTHMVLDEDVFTVQDQQVAARGERVTPPLLAGLLNYSRTVGIQEPFAILLPLVHYTA